MIPNLGLKGNVCHRRPGGRILLTTPKLRQNPIDLVIADHCTHFEEAGLAFAVWQAGLTIDLI